MNDESHRSAIQEQLRLGRLNQPRVTLEEARAQIARNAVIRAKKAVQASNSGGRKNPTKH